MGVKFFVVDVNPLVMLSYYLATRSVFSIHKPRPKPMLFPHYGHLLNWDILSLWQEEKDEYRHNDHEEPEKEEQPELQVTKHCQENLSNYKCEEHVH